MDGENFFERFPNWLRWIIALPVAVLACFIVPVVVNFANYFYIGVSDSIYMRTISVIASIAGFLYSIYYCVPKKNNIICGILSIVFIVYEAVIITIMGTQGNLISVDCLICLITAIVCVWFAINFIKDYAKE